MCLSHAHTTLGTLSRALSSTDMGQPKEGELIWANHWQVYEELLGLVFHELAPGSFQCWHPDVRCFKVEDQASGQRQGHFYLDLHPRDGVSLVHFIFAEGILFMRLESEPQTFMASSLGQLRQVWPCCDFPPPQALWEPDSCRLHALQPPRARQGRKARTPSPHERGTNVQRGHAGCLMGPGSLSTSPVVTPLKTH